MAQVDANGLRERYETAKFNWENPLPTDDGDDRRWAYEALVRAEYRLRELGELP